MNTLRLTIYGPDNAAVFTTVITPEVERKLNTQTASDRTVRQLRGKRYPWEKLQAIDQVLTAEIPEFAAWCSKPADLDPKPSFPPWTWSFEEDVDGESTLEFFLYSTASTSLSLVARLLIWIADGSLWLSKQSDKGAAIMKEKADNLR